MAQNYTEQLAMGRAIARAVKRAMGYDTHRRGNSLPSVLDCGRDDCPQCGTA